MIELCLICKKIHDTGDMRLFGIHVKQCPEAEPGISFLPRSSQVNIFTDVHFESAIVNAFVEHLTLSSPADREMMITYLRSKVCIECGVPDPDCACWEREEAAPS